MNVKIIKTGETAKVNDSYGMRLIEQGKAVLAPETKKPARKAAKTEAAEGDA